ncbi:MAG: amidase family protein [Spirosomataceae bacterium]
MGDVWFGGKTRNPWDSETGASGSSAGSGSAVAAGCLPFAIGTETLRFHCFAFYRQWDYRFTPYVWT